MCVQQSVREREKEEANPDHDRGDTVNNKTPAKCPTIHPFMLILSVCVTSFDLFFNKIAS